MASTRYVKHFFKVIYLHSVQPLFCWGLESPTKFSKRRPHKISILWGSLLEKKGWLFSARLGGWVLYWIALKGNLEQFAGDKAQKLARRLFLSSGWWWAVDTTMHTWINSGTCRNLRWDLLIWASRILINLSCSLMKRKKQMRRVLLELNLNAEN